MNEGGSENATETLAVHDSAATAVVVPLGAGGPGIGRRAARPPRTKNRGIRRARDDVGGSAPPRANRPGRYRADQREMLEKCRDTWRVNWIQDLIQDLRHALRRLRMAPAFTSATVLTLALGISATTSIFTLVDAVLLKSLPVSNPGELYRLGRESHCCYITSRGTVKTRSSEGVLPCVLRFVQIPPGEHQRFFGISGLPRGRPAVWCSALEYIRRCAELSRRVCLRQLPHHVRHKGVYRTDAYTCR